MNHIHYCYTRIQIYRRISHHEPKNTRRLYVYDTSYLHMQQIQGKKISEPVDHPKWPRPPHSEHIMLPVPPQPTWNNYSISILSFVLYNQYYVLLTIKWGHLFLLKRLSSTIKFHSSKSNNHIRKESTKIQKNSEPTYRYLEFNNLWRTSILAQDCLAFKLRYYA